MKDRNKFAYSVMAAFSCKSDIATKQYSNSDFYYKKNANSVLHFVDSILRLLNWQNLSPMTGASRVARTYNQIRYCNIMKIIDL